MLVMPKNLTKDCLNHMSAESTIKCLNVTQVLVGGIPMIHEIKAKEIRF